MHYVLYRQGTVYHRWTHPPSFEAFMRCILFGMLARGLTLDLPDFEMAVELW